MTTIIWLCILIVQPYEFLKNLSHKGERLGPILLQTILEILGFITWLSVSLVIYHQSHQSESESESDLESESESQKKSKSHSQDESQS